MQAEHLTGLHCIFDSVCLAMFMEPEGLMGFVQQGSKVSVEIVLTVFGTDGGSWWETLISAEGLCSVELVGQLYIHPLHNI